MLTGQAEGAAAPVRVCDACLALLRETPTSAQQQQQEQELLSNPQELQPMTSAKSQLIFLGTGSSSGTPNISHLMAAARGGQAETG